ncbi:MAG: hypothetical protein M9962_15565 [Oligoflexia bacterium]|nr:hypothetical protein [Oligoflexia bacterium]
MSLFKHILSVEKLEANKNFSHDIYLILTKNNKEIKVCLANDFLDKTQLEKFKSLNAVLAIFSNEQDFKKIDLYYKQLDSNISTETKEEKSSIAVTEQKSIEPESTKQIFSAESEITEEAQIIKNNKSNDEEESTFKSDDQEAAPEKKISASENEIDPIQKFSSDRKEPESIQKFSADKEEKDTTINRFSNTDEKINNDFFLVSGKKDPTILASMKIESMKEKVLEPEFRFSKSEEEMLIDETEKALLVGKISEELLDSDPKNIELKKSLNEIRSGERSALEFKDKYNVEPELNELKKSIKESPENAIITASELVSSALEKTQVVSLGESEEDGENESEATLMRSGIFREKSAMAAQFATYLGYSLGYSSENYLSEISLAAFIYFDENKDLIPMAEVKHSFLKEVFSTDFARFESIDNCKQILSILDKYFSHPNCDKTLKFPDANLIREIYENKEINADIDLWNATKWSNINEAKLDYKAMSLCQRSSRAALKEKRSIQSELEN